MAHQLVKTIILDSQREGVVHYTFISDGFSGELNKQVILDPLTDFNMIPQGNQGMVQTTGGQPYRQTPTFAVLEMWFSLQQMTGTLQYDNGVNPQTIWLLSSTSPEGHYDFNSFAGVKDRTGVDGTGRIILTTQGFAGQLPLGDQTPYTPQGSIVLRVQQYFTPQ